jgi:hypothetical protein
MDKQNYDEIIKNKTNEYYSSNSKNTIFKNKQKIELAKTISNSIDINNYLNDIIYIDQNNPTHIFVTYHKLKVIMHPDIFDLIVAHVDNLIMSILNNNSTYYLHVDIFSLTVSGVQRLKPFIEQFLTTNFYDGTKTRVDLLEKIFIYNSPSVITTIRIILEPLVKHLGVLEKVTYVKK